MSSRTDNTIPSPMTYLLLCVVRFWNHSCCYWYWRLLSIVSKC